MTRSLTDQLSDLNKWIYGYEKDIARAEESLKFFKSERKKVIRKINNQKWGK